MSNPNNLTSSYGSTGIECAYPYNGKMFFTHNSTPSASSWEGLVTGVNLCFIQRIGKNIKFVVNPQIEGPNILSSQSPYYVSNIPSGAKIKWTYTYIPNPISQQHKPGRPIVFMNGDSTSYVMVKRGKYLVLRDTIGPIFPRDSFIVMSNNNSMSSESTSTNSTAEYVFLREQSFYLLPLQAENIHIRLQKQFYFLRPLVMRQLHQNMKKKYYRMLKKRV